MKLIKILYVIIALIILFSFNNVYSQTEDEMHCGTTNLNMSSPYGIPHLTPGRSQKLRIAIIYVTFPDDDVVGFPQYTIWPKPTNPPYPSVATQPIVSLIEQNKQPSNYPFMTKYADYTMSDFFSEMSMGKFDVVGEEFAVILPENSTYYKNNRVYIGALNEIILNEAKTQTNINFANYNNWSLNNGEWEYGNTSDGKAEMIIICYRNVPNNDNSWFFGDPSVGGCADLSTGNVTIDNTIISGDCGIWALNQMYNLAHSLQLMEHEFTHRFLGHYEVGFMPIGNTKTTYCFTPYERSAIVDYLTYETIDQNGIYTRTLGDFIETGQTIKIQIPETNNYFWIANYQRKSPYDGLSRGGKNCYNTNYTLQYPNCSEGKGLYVFREGSGCGNYNEPYDVVSAEGRYNWNITNYHDVPPQPCHFLTNGALNIPVFDMLIGQANTRYSGIDVYRKAPTGGYVQILNDDPCSNSNGFFVTWDDKGDGKNAFNTGYDEIFSPYSNPPTSECNSSNTGLTIKLMSQNPITGAIDIKIYYSNNGTALSELPPSKPKNLKVTADVVNTESFHPKLNWDPNIEPDFLNTQTPGHYNIYRGISYTCDAVPTYTYLTNVASNITEYIDLSALLYNGTQGSQNCGNMKVTFSYKISAVDNTNLESVKSERGLIRGYQIGCYEQSNDNFILNSEAPKEYKLSNNYPNPFNPVTKINFALPKQGFVSLKIYDITGREVQTLVSEVKQAGYYSVDFNGSSLSSGVYFYRIQSDNFVSVKRMVLIK